MAISPKDVIEQENLSSVSVALREHINERFRKKVSNSEEGLDIMLGLIGQQQLESKKYIIIYERKLDKYLQSKLLSCLKRFPVSWTLSLFGNKKVREIVINNYKEKGWKVEYKWLFRPFGRHLKFTPLHKIIVHVEKKKTRY